MKTYFHVMDSAIGPLSYVWEEGGDILFLGCSLPGYIGIRPARKKHALLEKEIKGYLGQRIETFTVKARLISGSRFFKKVLGTLQNTSYGQVLSYKKLAEEAGYPLAWRAVGTALSKNPLMILIPCHRVVQASGKLGNFSGGVGIKKFLLDLESRSASKGE